MLLEFFSAILSEGKILLNVFSSVAFRDVRVFDPRVMPLERHLSRRHFWQIFRVEMLIEQLPPKRHLNFCMVRKYLIFSEFY